MSGTVIQGGRFRADLIFRAVDGGSDQILDTEMADFSGGGGSPIFSAQTTLAAVNANCGDSLVLDLTMLTDGGLIIETLSTLDVP